MRIGIAWSLSAAITAAACGSSKTDDGGLDAAQGFPSSCVADSSKGADSALSLTMGDKAAGMICPRGDFDFFSIQVAPGMGLLDVSLAYPSAPSQVTLQVRLLAGDGVTQVPNGLATDTNKTDGRNAIETTFAVPAPGAYFLRVGDAHDNAVDSVNSYVLQVSAAAEPDSHEPNDSGALAKSTDKLPGFFSYESDVDVYQVVVANPGSVLQMIVNNPAAAKASIEYDITDATLKSFGTGTIPPAATPTDLSRPAPGVGTFWVSFRYAAGSAPDRRPEAGYTVTLGELPEPDGNDRPPRNDTPATPTCLASGGASCAAVFAGQAVSFAAQKGAIGSLGDRDYFMFRATSAPAVVQATLRAPATQMDLALDIMLPHLASPCKADADCKVLAGSCTTDDDCEWSHHCIDAKPGACASANCRQCAGAGWCLPVSDNPAKSACGVTLYTARDLDGGLKTGADGLNVVRTAQPVFAAGPVFIVVHDNQDNQFDPAVSYSLDVEVAPEPDPMDNSTDPNARNNFYNPYPLQTTNLQPSQKRAKDISAEMAAGKSVAGYISYQTDEDWFWFPHPCPGKNCGLVFEWVQPGPSSVRPVFFLRTDTLKLHESWTYTGLMPTTAPITDVFGDGDCTECSFASAKHAGTDTAPFKYYLQVRDAGADDWDVTVAGRYEFRLKTVATGCPLACSELGATTCECFCKAKNECPAGPAL